MRITLGVSKCYHSVVLANTTMVVITLVILINFTIVVVITITRVLTILTIVTVAGIVIRITHLIAIAIKYDWYKVSAPAQERLPAQGLAA